MEAEPNMDMEVDMTGDEWKSYCDLCENVDKEYPPDFQMPGEIAWSVPDPPNISQIWLCCVSCLRLFHMECYFEVIDTEHLSEEEHLDDLKSNFECPICDKTYADKYPDAPAHLRW